MNVKFDLIFLDNGECIDNQINTINTIINLKMIRDTCIIGFVTGKSYNKPDDMVSTEEFLISIRKKISILFYEYNIITREELLYGLNKRSFFHRYSINKKTDILSYL